MLQGLVDATRRRLSEDGEPDSLLIESLEKIQGQVGVSAHYGLPQVTLVLPGDPDLSLVREDKTAEIVAARLSLPSGTLFVVADGQHRREAARKVREFLNDLIANRRVPRTKLYSHEGALSAEEMDAWIAMHETFRIWTMVSFEAHIGLDVPEARQMFTNYNCHVKPVKMDLNLEFDQNNPINKFAKDWLQDQISFNAGAGKGLNLRELAAINGFLFLGKTSIKSAPYDAEQVTGIAKDFWSTVFRSKEWGAPSTLLREVPVLKGLAKAWFYVFVARRRRKADKATQLRGYIERTSFDREWMETVPGLKSHTVPNDGNPGFRFSPAHNDIVARIVDHAINQ
jgi:hypothetical protein